MKNTSYFLILLSCIFLFVQSSSNPMVAQNVNQQDTTVVEKKSVPNSTELNRLSKALIIDSIVSLSNKIDSTRDKTKKCLSLLKKKQSQLKKNEKIIDSLIVKREQ